MQACGGVSRAAKGADCKSAGLRLRRFESYLPHQGGCSSMVEQQPSKLMTRVRFPSPAPVPNLSRRACGRLLQRADSATTHACDEAGLCRSEWESRRLVSGLAVAGHLA